MPQPVRSWPEPGTPWILGNVTAEFLQLALIPHDVIKRLMLPELARYAHSIIDLVGGKSFPLAQDFGQFVAHDRPDQSMHVIGHYHVVP